MIAPRRHDLTDDLAEAAERMRLVQEVADLNTRVDMLVEYVDGLPDPATMAVWVRRSAWGLLLLACAMLGAALAWAQS